MGNPRVALGAVVLVATLGAVAVLVARGSGGGTDRPGQPVRSKLTLERAVVPETGQQELLVSLPDERLNVLDTTGGETSVLLRYVDAAGAQKLGQQHEWPLVEEVGFPPHIHQLVKPEALERIRRCRLTARGIDFEGRVPGRVPRAQWSATRPHSTARAASAICVEPGPRADRARHLLTS